MALQRLNSQCKQANQKRTIFCWSYPKETALCLSLSPLVRVFKFQWSQIWQEQGNLVSMCVQISYAQYKVGLDVN